MYHKTSTIIKRNFSIYIENGTIIIYINNQRFNKKNSTVTPQMKKMKLKKIKVYLIIINISFCWK